MKPPIPSLPSGRHLINSMQVENGTVCPDSEAVYPPWLRFAYGFAVMLALQTAFCGGFCQAGHNLSHGAAWFWVSGVLSPENAVLFVPVMLLFAVAGGGVSCWALSRVKQSAVTMILGIAVLVLPPLAFYVCLSALKICVSLAS